MLSLPILSFCFFGKFLAGFDFFFSNTENLTFSEKALWNKILISSQEWRLFVQRYVACVNHYLINHNWRQCVR